MRHALSPLPALLLPLLTTFAPAPRAEACMPELPPEPRLDGRTLPAVGAVDVPVNARVFFASTDGITDSATATLQRGDDAPVEVAVDAVAGGFVLVDTVLEPRTTYTATLTLLDAAAAAAPVVDDGGADALVFTTGDATDTAAPQWQGDATLSHERVAGSGLLERVFASSCGAPPDLDFYRVVVPTLDESVAAVELNRIEGEGTAFLIDAGLPGDTLELAVPAGEAVFLELVAVDQAGNRSAPLVLEGSASAAGCSAIDGNDSGLAAAVLALLGLRRRASRPRRA